MPTIKPYAQLGGVHAETATVTNALAAAGITIPGTWKLFSEALILGIAGGLGAGYLFFDFGQGRLRVIVMGWQNRWNYTQTFYENLFSRLGLKTEITEGSGKNAQKNLEVPLTAGNVPIAWVDRSLLDYQQLSSAFEGCFIHMVNVVGVEDGVALIDDLAEKPFRVPLEALNKSRGRISSNKSRVMTIAGGEQNNVEDAIKAGITDCIEHLSQPSETFSIPVYRKWAKLMTHPKDKKGWPVLFKDRSGLLTALSSIYENTVLYSAGGGALRSLYGDFLNEAAELLSAPALCEAADAYHKLGTNWRLFAESALPDSNVTLAEARKLMHERREVLRTQGGEGVSSAQTLTARIDQIAGQANTDFPMGDSQINALFADLGERLEALYQEELKALETLAVTFKTVSI